MKVLNIISSAYRAVSEEQDDTIVWLSHALHNAGADLAVLLSGTAVNYVLPAGGTAPIAIGGRIQRNPPDVHGEVRKLAEKVPVLVVQEDLEMRGIAAAPDEPFRTVTRAMLPALLLSHDQVWHW
jgi:hypothetical protein